MNEQEILERFVSRTLCNPNWTTRPFVAESPDGDLFTVATDGHAIVRIRGVHVEPNYNHNFKPRIDVTTTLPWDLLEQWKAPNSPVRRFRLKREALGKPGPEHHCVHCLEDCITETCKHCNGTGADQRRADDDCPFCEGTGKNPVNTVDCVHCLATGWQRSGSYWLVGREYALLACELARILNTCGDIELMVGPDNTKPVGFRFAGGEGMLMPVRWGNDLRPLNE